MMRSSEFGTLTNDKDGGFCLIFKHVIDDEKDRLLNSVKYSPRRLGDVDLPSIVQRYRDVVGELQNVINLQEMWLLNGSNLL